MVNSAKLGTLAAEAFSNGLRLLRDAIFLYKRRSYPSAYFLAVLAQEEIAKAYLVDSVAFWVKVGDFDDDEAQHSLDQLFLLPRQKQEWLITLVDWDLLNSF